MLPAVAVHQHTAVTQGAGQVCLHLCVHHGKGCDLGPHYPHHPELPDHGVHGSLGPDQWTADSDWALCLGWILPVDMVRQSSIVIKLPALSPFVGVKSV